MKKNISESIKVLIKNNFFFSVLTENEMDFLISHNTLQEKFASELIVEQGKKTDHFYLILEGTSEVWVTENSKRELRAILQTGDIIGLLQSNITRLASASVLCVIAMKLLEIDDAVIRQLAERNPEFKTRITQHSQQIAAVNLLKRAFPFKKISADDTLACAKKMQTLTFAPGDIIFRQGEVSDYIYFIVTGEVEVFTAAQDAERRLVKLGADEIFGEVAALTTQPRNASVRTLSSTTLLAIHGIDLIDCLKKEENAVSAFQNFIYHRSRPKRIESVEIKDRINAEGERIFIIKNIEKTAYFQLSEQGWFIWQLLDGSNTINDINLKLLKKFQIFSPQFVENIITSLVDSGFVFASRWQTQENNKTSWWVRGLSSLRKYMELEVTLRKVDGFFSKTYEKIGAFLFQKFTYFLMAIVIFLGMIAFARITPESIEIIKHTPHSYLFLIALIPLQFLSSLLHESSHALTTKAAQRTVNGAGVGLYWLTPIFFVDTSDMWLSTPKQRIIVSSAGMISDLIMAGFATLIAWFLSPHIIAAFLWLFACLNYFSVVRNLDPLFEMDGYYILTNIFDRSNLRQDALKFLFGRRHLPKKNRKPEIFYWIICLIMFVVSLALTILFQIYVMAVLFPGLFSGKYSATSLILPLLVTLLFFLSVWSEGRRVVKQ